MPSKTRQKTSTTTQGTGKSLDGLQFGESVRWAEAKPELLSKTLTAVTDVGAALLLGRTSDGGAVSIQVLYGDHRMKLYAANAEALNGRLSQLWEWAETLSTTPQD